MTFQRQVPLCTFVSFVVLAFCTSSTTKDTKVHKGRMELRGFLNASHTFPLRTIFRRADRGPADIKQCQFLPAPRCPTRRAPSLPAPTSLRTSAMVQRPREFLPALLCLWGR